MIGYVTLEEAKHYIKQRYDLNKEDAEIERGLYRALDLIESIDVRDSGRSEGQELNFPRLCDNVIPENIKVAQSLEAYSIATTTSRATEDINDGVTSRRIGDMAVTYNTDRTNQLDNFKNDIARGIMKRYKRKTYGWN